MTAPKRIFPVAGLALLASLVALGFSFRRAEPADNAKTQLQVPSQVVESVTSDSAGSTSKEDYLVRTAAEAVSFTASAQANQTNRDYRANETATSRRNSRSANASATPLDDEADLYQPRLPLAFLDYSGVLPATEEVAAAVQKLRQDFINSTGAATADPADPNFAALWDQFQPTADDEFCAVFGTEACNALSIAEARQRGHF
jgi:hypothetical protein